MPDTLAWYELLYLFSALACVISSGYNTLVSLGDYLYAQEHPNTDDSVQIDLLELGKLYLSDDTSTLACGLVFLYLGIRSALLPNNPGSSDFWSITTGLIIFLLNFYCTIISLRNRFVRNKLDRNLQPSQTSIELVRHRIRHPRNRRRHVK